MSSSESRPSFGGSGATTPNISGPLDLFTEPNGGSIISPIYGYTVARNTTMVDYHDELLATLYTGVYDAREDLVHLAGQAFALDHRLDRDKRPRVMEDKFRLGFNTFCLAVIKADPFFVEEFGARVPRNVNSLRALQRALGRQEDRDPEYYQLSVDALEGIFARSERELRPTHVRGPRLVSPDYRDDNGVPRYLGPHQRLRLKVDVGRDVRMAGMKDICQRFVRVAVADTGGPLARTHAVQGGSDAYAGMLLGGVVAKNLVLDIAFEEHCRLQQEYPKQEYPKAA